MNLTMRDFAIRDLGCTCCHLWDLPFVACEKHHLNEGDQPGRKRRGEAFTVGLCQWHHVGTCHCTGHKIDCAICRAIYGPSWVWHKREFLDHYGTGDELLAVQDERIAAWAANTVGVSA